VVFINVQSLLGIDAVVSIMCNFLDFVSLAGNAYSHTLLGFCGI